MEVMRFGLKTSWFPWETVCCLTFGWFLHAGGVYAADSQVPPLVLTPVTPASAPAAADSTPAGVEAQKATPLKDLRDIKLETGIWDRRLKVPGSGGGNVDVPMSLPPVERPLSRKEFLRLKDRIEEKKDWAFVEQGQLTEDREAKSVDDAFKDKWDLKQEMKRRSWWEYGSKNGSSDARTEAGLREAGLGDSDSRNGRGMRLDDGLEGGRTGDLKKNRAEIGGSDNLAAHQASELSLKDIFSNGSSASKSSRGVDFGLKDLFATGANPLSSADREAEAAKRQEFRDFLNQSRVPKATINGFNSSSPVGNGLEDAGSRDTFNRGFGSDTQSRMSEFGRPPGTSGFANRLDAGVPNGFSSGAYSSQAPATYEQPRTLITPQMMTQPKRRF